MFHKWSYLSMCVTFPAYLILHVLIILHCRELPYPLGSLCMDTGVKATGART
jgi:hypothetical protein